MGYNIGFCLFFGCVVRSTSLQGIRLVDEFMARSNAGRCHSFEETGEIVARTAFKMFLGAPATLSPTGFNADKTCFSIVLEDNPLVHFVELPEELKKLKYCNILCGVIRGA